MPSTKCKMPCNIEGFFLDTLFCKQRNNASAARPLLTLDECLNDQKLVDDLGKMVGEDLAFGIEKLWYQARRLTDGSVMMLHGSQRPMQQSHELGVPIKGYSWSDAEVICYLTAHFSTYDHLIFCTQDTRRNVGGVSDILTTEVEPVLKRHHRDRYGLTVFMKKPKTSNVDYGAEIRQFLVERDHGPGYRLIEL